MHIFIDESGPFALTQLGEPGFCCVGALVVPESTHSLLVHNFERIRSRWKSSGKETKGNTLNADQVAKVIDLLRAHKAVYLVTGTIMSILTSAIVEAGKQKQAHLLTASLTPGHQPTLVAELHDLRARMEKMSPNQFVQFMVLRKLIENVLRVGLNHFGFYGPRELGRFLWKIDEKNKGRSPYEICWSKLGPGLLQSGFLDNPLFTDPAGNFTYYNQAFFPPSQEWPDHLPRNSRSGTGRTFNLGAVLRDSFAFADSRHSAGIQMADIVTSAFRRAVRGNLEQEGWAHLGKLILRLEGRAVDLIHLPLPAGQATPDLPSDFRYRLDTIDAQAVVIGGREWIAGIPSRA